MEDFVDDVELASDDKPEGIPGEDVIDLAIIDIVEGLLGEEADDDAFDEASDVVFDIIGELVGRGEIKEIPDSDESEDNKQEWIKVAIPIISEAVKESLHDGFIAPEV